MSTASRRSPCCTSPAKTDGPCQFPHGVLPSMHSFRHTVASRAIPAGESVDEVAFLLGHRDANVTRAVDVRELADARRRSMRRSHMLAEFGSSSGSSRQHSAAGARRVVPGGPRRAGDANLRRPEAAPDHIRPRTRRASPA